MFSKILQSDDAAGIAEKIEVFNAISSMPERLIEVYSEKLFYRDPASSRPEPMGSASGTVCFSKTTMSNR